MDNFLIPPTEPTKEEQGSFLIPTTPEEEEVVPVPDRYAREIAERYAERNNITFEEALVKTRSIGPASVVQKDNAYTTLANTMVTEGIAQRKSLVELADSINKVNYGTQLVSTSGNAVDYTETYAYNSDPTTSYLHDINLLSEEVASRTEDQSWVGSTVSFVDAVFRDTVVGIPERGLASIGGMDVGISARTREAISSLSRENDPVKKKALVKEIVDGWSKLGFLNNNSFLMDEQLRSFTEGGLFDHEGLWTGIDLATAGLGRLTKTGKTGIQAANFAKARDTVDKVGILSGEVRSQQILLGALDNPQTTIEIERHTSPSITKIADTGTPSPGLAPVIENEASKKLINYLSTKFQDIYVKPEQITLATKRYIDDLKKTTNSHVVDVIKVQEGVFDNYNVTVKLGKDDGTGWNDFFSADKFARTHGGTVIRDENTDLFYVTKSDNVSLKGVSDPTQFFELSYNVNNNIRGSVKTLVDSLGNNNNILSPEHVSKDWLNTLLKRGETKIGAVIRDVYTNEHLPKINKLKSNEFKNINTIIENLRDGSDSFRRNYYSEFEFSEIYYKNNGVKPRQEVIDAYTSVWALNDAAYYLDADRLLKIKTGQNLFKGSFGKYKDLTIRTQNKDKIGKDAKVFDVDSGTILSREEFLKMEGRNLFIVPDGLNVGKSKATYITGDLIQSRALRHDDVLGYQPGGLRGPNAKYFSTQNRMATDIGGNKYFDKAITWFAGFSEKEAGKATKDFNTIIKEIRKSYGPAVDKTTLSNALGDVNLTNIIRKNNGFNPSVESVKDFIKFLDDAGLEVDDVITKNAEDVLPEKNMGFVSDYFGYGGARTYDDAYRLNADPSSATRNKMVHGYGGRYFSTLDPISGIDASFGKALNYLSVRSYVKNAMEGLIKGGKNTIENWDSIKNKSYFDQIHEAQFKNTVEGRAFARERDTIINRLNQKGEFAKKWEHFMDSAKEKIFDKLDSKNNRQVDVLDFFKKDPTVALRAGAYILKFGFWNVQQYFTQFIGSALTATIIPPKYGLRAFVSYMPMRLAMLRSFDKPFWDAIFSRIGRSMGMSKQDWDDLGWYMKESGRFEVNQTTAYLDSAHGMSSNSLLNIPGVRQVANSSDILFKEGEGAAVLISTNVAFREFREKFPTVNIRTREGLRALEEYVERRADALTLNMRRSSAAPWQKGILGVATQWQSVNARVLETLFFGRSLSKTEKYKLVGSQVAMYGATGLGIKELVDSVIEEYNLEPSPELYTFVKWGTLDGMTQVMTGVPTNTAERLAFAEGMRSTIENLVEGNIFQAIGGPVGSIGTTLWDNLYNLAANAWSGNTDLMVYDGTKVFREISSLNSSVQAYYLWNYQQHITKNGRVTSDIENPKAAAILVTLGAYLQEVNLPFQYADILKSENESAKSLGKRANEIDKVRLEAVKEKRWDDAREMTNLANALRTPLSPKAKKIFDQARQGYMTEFNDKISQDLIEAGKFELDKLLTNVTNPEGVKE